MIDREGIAAMRLKVTRKTKGLRIFELAAKAFVSKYLISQIENGRRRLSIETAIALAKVLKVRPEWLLALNMIQWREEDDDDSD